MKTCFRRAFIVLALFIVFCSTQQSAMAATRVYWYKKMSDGGKILYWVNSSVSYTSQIRSAEIEIEIPAAGYTNNMQLTKTSTQSSSKMDFHQYTDANDTAVARTYSYRANSSSPMVVSDKDYYDWYWCKIELNHSKMKLYPTKQVKAIVHEMLHGYGGKDTYSSDQTASIMYGDISGSATGVTYDANSFLNAKY